MFRIRWSRAVLMVATALGLDGSADAGDLVPFKGNLSGIVSHYSVNPTTDSVLVSGTGNATMLGEFTVSVPHLVDLPTRTAAGRYEFTAANGDTVIAEFTGQAQPTATPGFIYIVETATIVGGTGRFAGATGNFITERYYDRIQGTTTGSFTGTISPPHP